MHSYYVMLWGLNRAERLPCFLVALVLPVPVLEAPVIEAPVQSTQVLPAPVLLALLEKIPSEMEVAPLHNGFFEL